MTLEEIREDPEGILIPAFLRTNDGLAYVREHAKEIFEVLLSHWEQNASEWPPERDFDSLRQWFDVELYSSIYDAEDEAEASCTLN